MPKRGFSQNLNNQICNDLKNEKNISTFKLIKWAFKEASAYKNKNSEVMINRLPETFGIIDDARRLRNLIVHKKGLFHRSYKISAIKDFGIQEFCHSDYELYEKNQDLNVPIRLNKDAIINYNKAHIEAIHILHNSIQQRIFNYPGDGYSYKDEKKQIDWGRIYRGA